MPDLQNFAVSRAGTAALTVPVWSISGQVCDSQTGAVQRDFMGANAVQFPQVLSQLTAAQQDEFVASVVQLLLHQRGLL